MSLSPHSNPGVHHPSGPECHVAHHHHWTSHSVGLHQRRPLFRQLCRHHCWFLGHSVPCRCFVNRLRLRVAVEGQSRSVPALACLVVCESLPWRDCCRFQAQPWSEGREFHSASVVSVHHECKSRLERVMCKLKNVCLYRRTLKSERLIHRCLRPGWYISDKPPSKIYSFGLSFLGASRETGRTSVAARARFSPVIAAGQHHLVNCRTRLARLTSTSPCPEFKA